MKIRELSMLEYLYTSLRQSMFLFEMNVNVNKRKARDRFVEINTLLDVLMRCGINMNTIKEYVNMDVYYKYLEEYNERIRK